MTRRVLVTGASGDIGDAVGRILAETDGVEAHGAEAGDPWPGRLAYETVHRLPLASAGDYVETLTGLVATVGADVVLPLTEPELAVLAHADGAGLPLLWLGSRTVSAFLDKWSTAAWLDEHALPAPRTMRLSEATPRDLPLVVKPRIGSGGRGVRLVTDAWELEGLQGSVAAGDLVAQERLLPDDGEVTCALVRIGGHLRTLQLLRTLSGGLTSKATVVADPEVDRLLARVADLLELEGCLNVQLRMTPDGPRIFEINPRLSSTVMLRHRIGFSDLQWWLAAGQGGTLPPFEAPIGTRLFRRSDEAVVRP